MTPSVIALRRCQLPRPESGWQEGAFWPDTIPSASAGGRRLLLLQGREQACATRGLCELVHRSEPKLTQQQKTPHDGASV